MEYSSLSTFGVRNHPVSGYPNHDPPLAHFSAVLNLHRNQQQPEAVINITDEEEQERNHHLPPTIAVVGSLNVQNQLELLPLNVTENPNDSGGNIPDPPILVPDHNLQDEEEEELSGDDPSIPGINDQQTSRFNAPTVAPYALTMVLGVLVPVSLNLKHGKHTHLSIANPFVLLSVVGSGIAYMTFSIYSWLNDRSDYKMLKGVYYIACNLAFISLLMMLLLTT